MPDNDIGLVIGHPERFGLTKEGIPTGPLEATYNKIKTMQRQAYGFRDQTFFTLKIYALHLSTYGLVGRAEIFRSVSIQKPLQKSNKARSANVEKLLDGAVRGQLPFIEDSDKLKR